MLDLVRDAMDDVAAAEHGAANLHIRILATTGEGLSYGRAYAHSQMLRADRNGVRVGPTAATSPIAAAMELTSTNTPAAVIASNSKSDMTIGSAASADVVIPSSTAAAAPTAANAAADNSRNAQSAFFIAHPLRVENWRFSRQPALFIVRFADPPTFAAGLIEPKSSAENGTDFDKSLVVLSLEH